ncbi:MAG: hypothetical protein A3G23_13330 [Bacteroidetes bacterium RIFCSPLOWO2_12_FULL_37_12]|nr:MAG: hypothetical protein A3G23_13330 [Bacteroidetes bacterium RIFCSPLOWO2_12_FULL_37_12]
MNKNFKFYIAKKTANEQDGSAIFIKEKNKIKFFELFKKQIQKRNLLFKKMKKKNLYKRNSKNINIVTLSI